MTKTNNSRRFRTRVIAVSALATVLFPLLTLWLIKEYWIDCPFWDDWDFVPACHSLLSRNPDWSLLFENHLGHRLVLVRALNVLSLKLVGNNILVVVSQFAAHVGLAFLLWSQLKELRTRAAALLAPPLASAVVFSHQSAGLWFQGYCIQQSLTCLLFAGAVIVAARADIRRWSTLPFLAAMCMLSTLASAIGLFAWPAAGIALLLRRARARLLLLFSAAGLATVALYLFDWSLGSGAGASADMHMRAAYFLAFIGAPLGLDKVDVAKWIGGAGIVLYAVEFAALVCNVVKRKAVPAHRIALALIPALALASAIAGAVGRIELAGAAQAMSSRYALISGMFWFGLIGLVLASIHERHCDDHSSKKSSNILAALACVFAAVLFFGTRENLKVFVAIGEDARIGRLALANDSYVFDDKPGRYAALHPCPAFVLKVCMPLLKESGLPPFEKRQNSMTVGSRIIIAGTARSEGVVVDPELISKSATLHFDGTGLAPAIMLTGTVTERPPAEPTMALADETGLVLGFARPSSLLHRLFVENLRAPRQWRGFILKPEDSRVVRAFYKDEPNGLWQVAEGEIVVSN